MDAFVERLDDLPCYEQDSGPGITYQFVVRPGTMGLMSSGRVRLRGPTEKAMDTHPGWDQVYVVLKGRGTVVVEDKKFTVTPDHVVRIPRGTLHGVELEEGEDLEYIYVNAFRDEQAVRDLAEAMKP